MISIKKEMMEAKADDGIQNEDTDEDRDADEEILAGFSTVVAFS